MSTEQVNASPTMSESPRILVGVTGCIAIYKACELVRRLQDLGADVRVAMTKHATEFVSPLTFEALTHHPVHVEDCHGKDEPIAHITLGEWADFFVIAPCTANMMAKVANGIADDLVSTIALVAHENMAVVPAMNVHMFEAPVTQDNIAKLRALGITVIDPDSGYLACGDVGKGRFPDPTELAGTLMLGVAHSSDDELAGKRVLITAGPTREPIDPVRYISNRSSGKMGYALAEIAVKRGADVTLVSGPVAIDAPNGVTVIDVETAYDMREEAVKAFDQADIAIFAAAVADMRPKNPSDHKLKKATDHERLETIDLEETDDILATCGARKKEGQVVIGFAAETNDLEKNAREKLLSKGADVIVANDVSDGKVFGGDEDKVMLITASGVQDLPKMKKTALADKVLDIACANMF